MKLGFSINVLEYPQYDQWRDWRGIGSLSIGLELVYSKSSIADPGVWKKSFINWV